MKPNKNQQIKINKVFIFQKNNNHIKQAKKINKNLKRKKSNNLKKNNSKNIY